MWLCIRSGRQFEDTFENPHRGKVKQITNATNVILYARKQAIWEDIWKHTVGENQTIAASATMHPLLHAIWGNLWKGIVQVPCGNMKTEFWTSFEFHCSDSLEMLLVFVKHPWDQSNFAGSHYINNNCFQTILKWLHFSAPHSDFFFFKFFMTKSKVNS